MQFILQNTRSIDEVLCKADVDCTALVIYKRKCYMSKRSQYAIVNGMNVIDPTRQSPTYIYRLNKYMRRSVDAYVPILNPKKLLRVKNGDPYCHGLFGLVNYWSSIHICDYSQTLRNKVKFWHSLVIKEDNQDEELFSLTLKRDGIMYMFPTILMHTQKDVKMLGSINQTNRPFYHGAYISSYRKERTKFIVA